MVDKLAALVLARLKEKDLVELKAGEAKVLDRIKAVITEDMLAEEKLDREVEDMISAHGGNSGSIDHRKMFNMVKQKLARERGIVL